MKFLKAKKLKFEALITGEIASARHTRWDSSCRKCAVYNLASIAGVEPAKPLIVNIFNKSIPNLFDNLNDFRGKKFKVVDEAFKEK